ncbi:MAG: DUF3990 domain-containing protein [Bacteroides sp.]|nr:DUF3990 domain-containing protein [Bacteroides sp.]
MKLYHGSNVIIDKIDLMLSKPYKDFGRGFYLSAVEEQAQKMAMFRALTLGGTPLVSAFEFDERHLTDGSLTYLSFESYTVEWAEFVFRNRNEAKDFQHEYDIVYGPIANDKIGLQIQKLEDGSIGMDEFLNRVKYFKGVTFQYYFGTERAISYLRKL